MTFRFVLAAVLCAASWSCVSMCILFGAVGVRRMLKGKDGGLCVRAVLYWFAATVVCGLLQQAAWPTAFAK